MQTQQFATVSGLPWPGVHYFCTTRVGGTSAGAWSSLNLGLRAGDDAARVALNRQALRARLPGEPAWLRQVHGADVFDADSGVVIRAGADETAICLPSGREGDVAAADASITTQPQTVLAIMTADCLPVVIASADGLALGVAHAGWRGLAQGVLENTLAALRRRLPGAAAWRAWVGPGISQAHFEVGLDVYQAFVAHDATAAMYFADKEPGRKWLADLPSLARHRLVRAGIDHVELSGACTYACPEQYYSYRRDGVTGRLATVAWLAPGP